MACKTAAALDRLPAHIPASQMIVMYKEQHMLLAESIDGRLRWLLMRVPGYQL